MKTLKNKIRRIKSIIVSIENAPSVLLGTQLTAVIGEMVTDSELLIVQINEEENEFLFV